MASQSQKSSMSCGLGTCVSPLCYLCTVITKLPQPGTLMERQAKYAVPDLSRKKGAKHPSQKKSRRKALEPSGLRVR